MKKCRNPPPPSQMFFIAQKRNKIRERHLKPLLFCEGISGVELTVPNNGLRCSSVAKLRIERKKQSCAENKFVSVCLSVCEKVTETSSAIVKNCPNFYFLWAYFLHLRCQNIKITPQYFTFGDEITETKVMTPRYYFEFEFWRRLSLYTEA